jgi:catechol 2,3-dioxygenase-like lactoylglutathione lyase family enzyme
VPVTGPLNHIDISVGYPERSIPFYQAFFTALGYKRWKVDAPAWREPGATRATWSIKLAGGAIFGIELRPARTESRERRYDRYEPGPHHLAFHADSPATVDRVHEALLAAGGEVLDPPTDYSGHAAYSEGYYAVFFADPDGLKLEVAHIPQTNP